MITKQGLRLDLRVVPPESYGDLLQHFTGSKDHNVALREQAQRDGLSVSEYGVTVVETGEVHTFEDEESLYAFLGYSYIPPELRENGGELEAARRGTLPRLVELGDLCGEMHCHSTWSSDGKATIEEMARTAAARGYEFLCLTDHSHYLREGRLEQQWREIDEVNARVAPFRVLRGVEANITARRAWSTSRTRRWRELDWVVASLHTSLDREPDRARARRDREPARRLHRASDRAPDLEASRRRPRPRAGRRRAPWRPARRSRSTASPTGSTCATSHARLAGEAGVRIPVNTDAHSTGALGYAEFGIGQARRAWLTKEQVLNTRPGPRSRSAR